MWFKLNTTFTTSLGTLSELSNSWSITRNLTNYSTTSTTTSVTKGGKYSATFTLNTGCTYSSHKVTMGGTDITSNSAISFNSTSKAITITNLVVTGALVITAVATGASSGGSSGGGGTTPGTGLDAIAYETLTYRDIFITNNYAPNINNNSMANSKSGTYTDSAGSTTIKSDSTAADNYVPPYSLYVSGTSSQQARSTVSDTSTNEYFLAANVKVTNYTKGYCGMIFGSNTNGCASSVTNGYEVFSTIGDSQNASGNSTSMFYIGSASSANLTGYINNPVAVKMSIFTTAPSLEQLTALYKQYTALLIAGEK